MLDKWASILNRNYSVKTNIAANILSNIGTAVLSIIFVPIYVRFIGVEAYGLIGIFASLQAILVFLDLGISSALSRELAILSNNTEKKAQETRNLVRSLELVYWATAIFIGIIAFLVSPFLAKGWVTAEKLSTETIEQCFVIMSVGLALQFPTSFYSGGLLGLQKMVLMSFINLIIGLLRSIGAIVVLRFVSPEPQAFFIWQSFLAVFQTFIFYSILWLILPKSNGITQFDFERVKQIWKFALGMSAISFLTIIYSQVDKIFLSKMLSLESFGYYTLASLVIMSLLRITAPIFQSLFPKFAQLYGEKEEKSISNLYHQGSQLIAVAVFPVCFVLAFFSYQVLLVWQKDPEIANKTHLILSILIIGAALNAIMIVPFAVQLASGWTRLNFYMMAGALVFYSIMMILIVPLYVGEGAALVWTLMNLLFAAISVPIMHTRILKSEMWQWLFKDNLAIIIPTAIVVFILRFMMPLTESRLVILGYLGLVFLMSLLIAVLSASKIRQIVWNMINKYLFKKVEEV